MKRVCETSFTRSSKDMSHDSINVSWCKTEKVRHARLRGRPRRNDEGLRSPFSRHTHDWPTDMKRLRSPGVHGAGHGCNTGKNTGRICQLTGLVVQDICSQEWEGQKNPHKKHDSIGYELPPTCKSAASATSDRPGI